MTSSPHPVSAFCRCIDCSRGMVAMRCAAQSPDGYQCGDYKHHRGQHTILVATVFSAAAKRIAAAEVSA